MEQNINDAAAAAVKNMRLPRYEEIPDVGLYLEQTTHYISECLKPLDIVITGSMVSNYVKRSLVANPVKKLYSREQIAYLIFIAVAKSALSLEDIQLLIQLQRATHTAAASYNYFCRELENILQIVFGLKDSLDDVGYEKTEEKTMLRNTVITVAHKVYLDKCLAEIRKRT